MNVFELQISNPGKSGFVFNSLFKTADGAKRIADRHSKAVLEWRPGIHPQTEYAVAATPASETDPLFPQLKHETIYYIAPREVLEELPP